MAKRESRPQTRLGGAVKTVVGKLSRRLQVRVLPGAPVNTIWFKIHATTMVGVAQLVEPRVVIPVVVGSSPIVHPNFLRIRPSGRAPTSNLLTLKGDLLELVLTSDSGARQPAKSKM